MHLSKPVLGGDSVGSRQRRVVRQMTKENFEEAAADTRRWRDQVSREGTSVSAGPVSCAI